jgi:hypothetical protein
MSTAAARVTAGRVIEGLLWIAIVLSAAVGVTRILSAPAGFGPVYVPGFTQLVSVPITLNTQVSVAGAPVMVDADQGTVDSVTGGPPVEVDGPFTGTLYLWEPSTGQRLAWLLPGLVGAALVIGVLALLLKMARALRQSDPFTPANARRMTVIAWLVAVGGMAVQVLAIWSRWWLIDGTSAKGIAVHDWGVSFLPLFAGIGLAFLAAIFRAGTRLRDDVAGLV